MNVFHNKILTAINTPAGNQELAKLFLNGSKDFCRYVIGKNDQSKELINLVDVKGVIDDFNESELFWNNIPVISSKDLLGNSIVVNCSTSISPLTVNQRMIKSGITNIIGINEVISAANGLFPLPKFVAQMRLNYQQNAEDWFKVYGLMSDNESRKTLFDVMRYRLTADASFMKDYSVRINDQYFEDFMHYSNETFADVGGFDGDSTNEFCTRYPDYEKVLFFEPSEKNMLAAKERLKNFKNIEYFTVGLSDRDETLFFNSNNGSASSISSAGETKIDVTSLDSVIKEPVSTIKMDIEGWELKALAGSRIQIMQNQPKLAIAVYHNASDFWMIPEYILSLYPGYKLYLRHYTEGWSETVMYFVPENVII